MEIFSIFDFHLGVGGIPYPDSGGYFLKVEMSKKKECFSGFLYQNNDRGILQSGSHVSSA